MLVIEVQFLTGRYSATSHHNREEPEWPPHGARLFSALVAALAEGEPPCESERKAMEWLETLPAPSISAPEVARRRVVSHFVPVNDTAIVSSAQYISRMHKVLDLSEELEDEIEASGGEITKKVHQLQNKIDKLRDVGKLVEPDGKAPGKAALETSEELIPDGRGKQERHFPSVTLLVDPEPEARGGKTPNGSASKAANGSATIASSGSAAKALVGYGLAARGSVNGGRAMSSYDKNDRLPVVTFAWEETPTDEVAEALDTLLARVTRLGHSSSLVSCRLLSEASAPTHVPGKGTELLRWVRNGQVAALEREFLRHKASRPRSLPFKGVRYSEVASSQVEARESIWPSNAGNWIVFEIEPQHRRLPMTRTVEIARVLRQAVLRYVPDPIPQGISGHTKVGAPIDFPHVGFVALPNVGHEHADGRLMGLAIALPYGLDDESRRALLRGIGLWERQQGGGPLRLTLGGGKVVEMYRRQPPFSLVSLRRGIWARPATRWTSVTPIALPRHPGKLSTGSNAARAKAWKRAEDAVRMACLHVDLPKPRDVEVSMVSRVVGARSASDFPLFSQGSREGAEVARRLIHATVTFEKPVSGPLIIGSGRFLGLGHLRPVSEDSAKADSASASESEEVVDNG